MEWTRRLGRRRWLLPAGALGALLLAVLPTSLSAPSPVPSGYAAEAVAQRAYTTRHLAYYGGATDCASAPYVTYSRSDADATRADAWYVALQVSADAALVSAGVAEARCELTKALDWLERLRDAETGGYSPRADLEGRHPTREEHFSDDNALIGLALLDAAAVQGPERRREFVARARRVAEYLVHEHWDDAFGGGLWWSTRGPAAAEGKPAQANALAATLFLRLAAETDDSGWGAWADRVLAWLDQTLWDEHQGLYRWAIHYAEPSAREGRALSAHYFNYDQGLAIAALLERSRRVGSIDDLIRAQRIAGALDEMFWDPRRPGYTLRGGVTWIYPVFAAWLTPPLVALHRADGDSRWLEMARRNVEALKATMRDSDGGYLDYAWDCTRWLRNRDRCPADGWVVSATKSGNAQAAMQQALAVLATADPDAVAATR